LWEVNADGSNPHPVLPGWNGGLQAESAMSADGRYSVFMAGPNGLQWDLWVMREKTAWFPFSRPKPARLTTGPLGETRPQFSPDGRRIFYIGHSALEQLIRYDPKLKSWVPYLGGIDAFQLEFSREGDWVTYVGPPGHSVWYSRADGSTATQLTTPPLNTVNPRLSPDGKRIVFYGAVPGQPVGIFVVPASGGAVEKLVATGKELEASWSPDGQKVLYMVDQGGLAVINVQTRQVENLPDSEGLRFPRWSPDGKYAAAPDAHSSLWLYNMTTHQRTLLTTLGAGYPLWSSDSRYVYFENSPCTIWYRVGVKDRVAEKVAGLAGVRMPPTALGWVGNAPDGSVISVTDVSTSNIYAIDWETP
jgi:Tol biopolymer transport system component